MSSMHRLLSWVLPLVLAACGEDKVNSADEGAAPAPKPEVQAVASAEKPSAPRTVIDESDFSENDRNRDPFRSFARAFIDEQHPDIGPQRDVVLKDYSLDELKLIGIVTRMVPAKAMLLDPTGKGHVIQRGQFVGRADVVAGTGRTGSTYQVNWRVDRIRDGDVVLVREDPANPDVPTLTRVISLRAEPDAQK
jgi:type IV pilus assembly protein PilP